MIRKTKPSDSKQIESLMKSVAGFWDNKWRKNVVKLSINLSHDLSYVYIQQKKIVGFVCAHDCGFRAYLSELVVDPSVQGQGIASKLLKKIEKVLKQKRCTILIADVWKDAVGFYQKQGWSKPKVILLRKRIN